MVLGILKLKRITKQMEVKHGTANNKTLTAYLLCAKKVYIWHYFGQTKYLPTVSDKVVAVPFVRTALTFVLINCRVIFAAAVVGRYLFLIFLYIYVVSTEKKRSFIMMT